MKSASFIEFFSSIQGEGMLIGERMIFSRFDSCNLSCNYCDTPMGRPRHPRVRMEKGAGSRNFGWGWANPISVSESMDAIRSLHTDKSLHRWISLTGGEPLLYQDFMEEMIPSIRELGLKILLETNGTIPPKSKSSLSEMMKKIDMVSMDIKETRDGAKEIEWEEMLYTTELAGGRYVKMVVRPDPNIEHFVCAAKKIHQADPQLILILMPVTPYGIIKASPEPWEMLNLQSILLKEHSCIRVIPQTHRMIGQI